jgi:hypothetical protein
MKKKSEFYELDKIICELNVVVNLYEELYGDKENVKFLNRTSPHPFSVFQKSMFFEIICRLSALFDPPGNKAKNLTLEYLLEKYRDKINKEIYFEAESIKYDFSKTNIKSYRNKVYAHYDLNKYFGKKQIATNISYKAVNDILENLSTLIKKIGLHVGGIDKGQILVRETKLPENSNGLTLLNKLKSAEP